MTTIVMRLMEVADLDTVMAIQDSAYHPSFHERREVYAEKQRLFPPGCWLAEVEGEPVGYLFSHPWSFAAPPALDAPLAGLPPAPDCYYIHDVAVARRAHRMGVGRSLAHQAQALAAERGFSQMALIAIQDSPPFWQRFGFQPVEPLSALMREKLASYGSDARLMHALR